MARSVITVTTVTVAGVADAADHTGSADGSYFDNKNGRVLLRVSNSDGATARDVTIQTPATVKSGTTSIAVDENTVSIPASSTRTIGPFKPEVFLQSDGTIYVDYDSGNETDLTVVAFELPAY